MENFAFTLQIEGIDINRPGFESAFYGGNCADALIRVVHGTLFMDFSRDADTYGGALEAAFKDVAKAGGRIVKVSRA
jgi:hypothetical protein